MTCDATDIAAGYAAYGWAPVPIPPKSKAPVIAGWQRLRIMPQDAERYFGAADNTGVLLGEPSGMLVDVDLDHPLAVELANEFLPETETIFGRASKPRSHWLYRCWGPVATHKRTAKPHGMIVELRSTGCQTVFPGSTHPSGESIAWDTDGEPASIGPDDLRCAVDALADAVERRLGVAPSKPAMRARPAGQSVATGSVARARAYLAALPPAVSGQGGHDATFRAACALYRFGVDDADALALMSEYSARCVPPWSPHELSHKLADARQRVDADGEMGVMAASQRQLQELRYV